MFSLLKKIFHDPDRESITIFEKSTNLRYEASLFPSLSVLTITKTTLKNLHPFAKFQNLKIVNLSHNQINSIEPLKELKKLQIIDLRFNQLSSLPAWLFEHPQPLRWSREYPEQKGIFLEGNPLPKKIIKRLQKQQKRATPEHSPIITPPPTSNPLPPPERLFPLKTQHLLIVSPHKSRSEFLTNFSEGEDTIVHPHNQIRLNLDWLYYDKEENLLLESHTPQTVNYLLVILQKQGCCIRPHILSMIQERYPRSKIFLVMEQKEGDIQEKIAFFKSYDQQHNIVHIFHAHDQSSYQKIKDEIFYYLEKSNEVNSLWRINWLELKAQLESRPNRHITQEEYRQLSKEHQISSELSQMLWEYFIRIGTLQQEDIAIEAIA